MSKEPKMKPDDFRHWIESISRDPESEMIEFVRCRTELAYKQRDKKLLPTSRDIIDALGSETCSRTINNWITSAVSNGLMTRIRLDGKYRYYK
jgi:hypothetical protein